MKIKIDIEMDESATTFVSTLVGAVLQTMSMEWRERREERFRKRAERAARKTKDKP